jgi:thiamine-monophosphate kinase
MELKNIGEFGLIEDVIAPEFTDLIKENMVGIGDDCSIVPFSDNNSMIFTTDMLIEKTHFLRNKITPYQLGFKSLAVNLSDIAAMGGNPSASYLSLGLPKDIDVEWVREFMKGYKALSHYENTPLLGGDTTSCEDKVIINVGVTGEIKNNNIKKRRDALEGDLICVTGYLGDSAAGLQMILYDLTQDEAKSKLVKQHLEPHPHVSQGKWLSEHNAVHAMMDVSDGISSDLGHILKASGVSATIQLENIPLSNELKELARDQNWNPYEIALSGGEDYVLLFTIDKNQYREISNLYSEKFSMPLYNIGYITKGEPKITYKQDNTVINNLKKGYTHF